jgi:arylsulfatase A-like enzyme
MIFSFIEGLCQGGPIRRRDPCAFESCLRAGRLFNMVRRARLFFLACLLIPAFFSVPAFAAGKPNLVLITLDSARADRMGFLGSRNGLTPALDNLARQAIIFERAYAQAPLTVVSHATLLTGTYPQTHQVNELASALAPGLPYLPDLLHAQGYRTAAFVGSILLDPGNGSAPGFDRGFDTYDAGFRSQDDTGPRITQRRGEQVVAHTTKWLTANTKSPIFLWVHLWDPHAPYDGGSYDHAVSAADAALGKLIATLRAQKLYDDSVIVVTADHGESLGAHGEETHGIFLYDETIRVPLLVKLPQNQLAGKPVKGRVRLVDVAPTILEAVGVPVPSQMQGQSLLRIAKSNPDVDQPVYARSDFPQQAFGWSPLESWRAGKYLYIRSPKPELYDLVADPEAAHNLAQTSKATLETMASQLAGFDSRLARPAGQFETNELSSSELQKLASLGYVGLQRSAGNSSPAATGTDPKDAISLANQVLKAAQFLDAGNPQKTIAALQQMPSQANCYLVQYILGTALLQTRQYPQALEHLHKAIEQQPNSAWAHYVMGASLLKTGDYKTAVVHLELATARLPKSADAHRLLAQAYDHLGRAGDAQSERAKAAH